MSGKFIHNFKLKVHECEGTEFENLFSKVMSYYSIGFDKVKPHGNIGDRGNDGWVFGQGIYYQVYAPEDLPKNEKNSLDKMKEDFNKLHDYWSKISPVKEFYYVVNDKYKGIPPHLNKAIAEIKESYNLNEARVIGSTILESFFLTLSNEQKSYIAGDFQGDNYATERYLVDQIKNGMHLSEWYNISDNLVANGMQTTIVDAFYDTCQIIEATEMPGRLPNLEASIMALAESAYLLCQQLTDLKYTCECNGFWKRDMSWKQVRVSQEEYHKKYAAFEHWRRELFRLHYNLAYALNIFSAEVRKTIDADFFMGAKFGVNDSIGTYNNLTPMYLIPESCCYDYRHLFNIDD